MSITRKVARRQDRLYKAYPDYGSAKALFGDDEKHVARAKPINRGSSGNRARKQTNRFRLMSAYARWLTSRLMCIAGRDAPSVLDVKMPDAYHTNIARRGTTISPPTLGDV